MTLSNARKAIFVTGAASGIGAETARHFVRKGWFAGLYDIDMDGLAMLAAELGDRNCVSGRLDVRLDADWSAAVAQFSGATGGAMHLLFNNAGIGRHGWFEDILPADCDAIIDINVKGVIKGIHSALPLLKATPGARIVNVASTAGFVGSPQLAVYSASKFAVRGLTEALDIEFEPLGIKVTSLAPWFVDTPILQMGDRPGSNHRMSDDLEASGMKVYPVSLAAEGAWQAAHGTRLHYGVGDLSTRTRFMARFLPGVLRRQIAKRLPARDR